MRVYINDFTINLTEGVNMQRKNLVMLSAAVCLLLPSLNANAGKAEFEIGAERYRETYREYTNGNERFMQQRGNMNSVNAALGYRFNDRHAARLEGRYSRGKIDYTGGTNGDDGGYGSLTASELPRKAYDVRALYAYSRPLKEGVDLQLEGGVGYRVLKDESSRKDAEDYDRKNKTLYAHVGAGLDIALPRGFGFQPKAAYNHMLRGRQYSYVDLVITNKQKNGRGVEVDLPVYKKLANGSKVSLGPFYRGWKVPDSNEVGVLDDEDPSLVHVFKEPKTIPTKRVCG